MLLEPRSEVAPPPLAIDLAGEDLASAAETWTALPDLGETTLSDGGLPRGTDYMHARFASPVVGRFLSIDPATPPDATMVRPQMWNRYSYVVGNPLKWSDPSGETINLAGIKDPEERERFLAALHAFTGNKYGVDENQNLILLEVGADSSSTATDFLNAAIGSENIYVVEGLNGSPVNLGRAYHDTNTIALDFKDFTNVAGPKGHNLATYNVGAVFVHELAHLHGNLEDPKGATNQSATTGPTIDFVNQIRADRGFLLRGPAYSGAMGFNNRLRVNFYDPATPRKIFYIRPRLFER